MSRGTRSTGVREKQLDWVPEGRPAWHEGWINGYARGLQLIADHLNVSTSVAPVAYDKVLGDLGVAFMMPADAPSLGRYDGFNDVGWWPLEPLGLVRLAFLEGTIGRSVNLVTAPDGTPRDDPVALYAEWFEPTVQQSIDVGRPALAGFGDWWCIVTGYDTETHTLFGMCPNVVSGEEKVDRVVLEQPMGWLLVIGDAWDAIEREAADAEALRFAVDLHHDRVLATSAAAAPSYALRHSEQYVDRWTTGAKSFECWTEWLEDTNRYGEAPHPHSNSKGFLVRNRRTAIRYLRAMKQRHPERMAGLFESVVCLFDNVVAEAQQIDTSDGAVSSVDGRKRMISQIEATADLERQAFAAVQEIVEALT